MIMLAAGALLLPGLAWWAWLGKRKQDPLVSLAQLIGVSLVSIILIAEAAFILGIRFSMLGIGVILAVFAGLAAIGLIYRGLRLPRGYQPYMWIGLLLFGATLAWRLYQARDLLLPNWVDGQHHFLIVRTILEHGGLPDDLSPYLPVPFYYHYGFHITAALFTAISGLQIGQVMLVLGQALNACISLSVYALGKALWKDWRPAAAAALLVSFATRMPAYYLSWGRYTLTTGLVLLPLAMGMAMIVLRKPRRIVDIATLALLTAGVLLSHYFAGVLLALFIILLALGYLIARLRKIKQALFHLSGLVLGALLGFLLAIPWLWRTLRFSTLRTNLSSNFVDSIGAILKDSGTGEYVWYLLGPESNHWLLLVAGIGLFLALILKRKWIDFGVWSLTLAAFTLPGAITLAPFRADHFAIVLFLPVTLWAGWLFWQVGGWLATWLKRRWVIALVMVVLVGAWIAWDFPLNADIINPVTVLVTEDDLAALAWVQENIPQEARFLINTAHWLSGVYRGVDGGGWLLPYTGRWSIVPTVFYGFSPDAVYKQEVRGWGEQASTLTTCSDEFWALVDAAEVDWIYLREGVGSLKAEGLVGCEGIEGVYEGGGVRIYQIGHK
jgi:hypothetical protein